MENEIPCIKCIDTGGCTRICVLVSRNEMDLLAFVITKFMPL